jgi:HAD superfamily hydrolase (TIGR01509 family)
MSVPRRGLFFDLDGTLADSLPALRRAYDDFLGYYSRQGGEAEFEILNGPPLAEVVALLGRGHGLPGKPEEWLALYRTLTDRAHEEATPAQGAREMLERAKARGWTVAVVTSAAAAAARAWLKRVRLDGFIADVVGGDEVKRGKPDPEPYRLALERTRCIANDSLAVEDGVQGARAALAAGLPTWVLGRDFPKLRAEQLYRGRLASLGVLSSLL